MYIYTWGVEGLFGTMGMHALRIAYPNILATLFISELSTVYIYTSGVGGMGILGILYSQNTYAHRL